MARAEHHSIVRRLAEAELLERFIHRRYVGTKRYSLDVPITSQITSQGVSFWEENLEHRLIRNQQVGGSIPRVGSSSFTG